MINPYEMTWKQYQKTAIDASCKVYTESSRKEVSECYPDFQVRLDHSKACYEAAQNGIILKRSVLDCLDQMHRNRIFHDFPDYLVNWFKATGKHYIDPAARKLDKWGDPK
jgi:hypothetical protein